MKYAIETLERSPENALKDNEINFTLAQAYLYSKDAQNELVNFAEVIWERDIPSIIDNCRQLGIREFTISSTFSGLIATIAEFEENGCTLDGIVKINSRYETTFINNDGVFAQEKKVIPAFKMTVN